MSRKFRIFVGVAMMMLAVDQLVKLLVRINLSEHQSIGSPWPGVFELTLTYNKGVAFGMLQGFGVYMAPVALIIAGLAGYYSFKSPKESIWTHVSLALIASGAVGNLYDRLVLGRVTDMFWFRLIDFPVFNVADSCITVGTTLLILNGVIDMFKKEPTKEEPA